MDPITIALGLASLYPRIAGWMDKSTPDRETIAGHVIDAAMRITGIDDGEQAARAINESPEYQAMFIQQMTMLAIVVEKETSARFQTLHETIRKDSTSRYWLVRSWRPIFGLVVAGSLASQFFGSLAMGFYAIWREPATAVDTINAIMGLNSSTVIPITMALAVLGVQINKRSQDKQIEAGLPVAPGIIGAVASRIMPAVAQQWGVDPDADAKTFGEGKPGK